MARKPKIVRGEDIAISLCRVLGIDPGKVYRVVIDLEVKQVAKFTAYFHGTDTNGEALADAVKEYRLIEASEVDNAD